MGSRLLVGSRVHFHVDGFVAVGMEELVVDLVAEFEG